MHLGNFACLFLLNPAGPVAPENTWPQWRGPTGDSVALSRKLPTHWSNTDNVIWKASLPGWGNSTPAIWGDVIFLTTQEKDRLLLLRLERSTGKVIWQREVGTGNLRRTGPVGNGKFHDEHNLATPSPVTNGKHVWVHFGTGLLACYDFEGTKNWSTNLTKRFGPYTIWWGHGNSPVLYENLIISVCMQDPKGDGQSYVVAHEQTTGAEKWVAKRATGATSEPADSYTTPIFYRHDGIVEMIVFGGNVLDAYDPGTGKRLWHCSPFKGNRVISGPTLLGDTVVAVQGMQGPAFAIKAGGSGDVTDTHVRWTYRGGTPDAATPVFANGLVFLANNSGTLTCVDAATGKEQWKQRLGVAFRATPLVAGDHVYFLGKDGKTTIVKAAREFKIIAESDLAEDTMASPAVAGDSLFIRTKEHLYRIDNKEK
jgi:outer membrane protein assembly factor BamB